AIHATHRRTAALPMDDLAQNVADAPPCCDDRIEPALTLRVAVLVDRDLSLRRAGMEMAFLRRFAPRLVPFSNATRTPRARELAALRIDDGRRHPLRHGERRAARLVPAGLIELRPRRRREPPAARVVADLARRVVAEPHAGDERRREADEPHVFAAVRRPCFSRDRRR